MLDKAKTTHFIHHKGWLVFTAAIVACAMILGMCYGNGKSIGEISALDIVGEGCVVVLTFGWIMAVLASRPPGKVTSLLTFGLGCFLFSMSLDVLDEFLRYPDSVQWLSHIESYPAALGMVVMTVALYLWHQEQRAITLQLRRREWDYRSHQDIDPITQLYRGDYWRSRVESLQSDCRSGFVALVDINDFSQVNREHGQFEGDRYLNEIAQLIVMGLREQDLACRYAGDRFAILLPDTEKAQAQLIVEQLVEGIRHVAFRSKTKSDAVYLPVRCVLGALSSCDSLSSILNRLIIRLDNRERNVA
ncbi:sensor domain-containing diguanylate cyclase [Alteromonas sp. KUL49]|uniref:GGDEF domain-containing protein n=1 Tax=Alteromonas sp. KUL49 TaxID=2480798 RepID=UPI00102EE519|nr:sensor domain-containing diguanylate cyclase [Alteromonas sp. KUL49]TAP40171.1 sensor domain-containing diguanylate cyclase [Alteromonas sp. KUL49]GEA11293.1 GGDEF domain-containing protein [Alteromonas sp. KUL49]